MKKNLNLYLLLAVLFCFVLSCKQNTQTTLSTSEKEELQSSVLDVFNTLINGMNEHQPEEIAKCYWNDTSLVYVAEGQITKGWEALLEKVTTFYTDSMNLSNKIVLDEILVDVLDKNYSVVTANGIISFLDDSGELRDMKYSITDIFKSDGNSWVIINEHESISF